MPPRLPRVWQSIPISPILPTDFGVQLELLLPWAASVERAGDTHSSIPNLAYVAEEDRRHAEVLARRRRRARCILGDNVREWTWDTERKESVQGGREAVVDPSRHAPLNVLSPDYTHGNRSPRVCQTYTPRPTHSGGFLSSRHISAPASGSWAHRRRNSLSAISSVQCSTERRYHKEGVAKRKTKGLAQLEILPGPSLQPKILLTPDPTPRNTRKSTLGYISTSEVSAQQRTGSNTAFPKVKRGEGEKGRIHVVGRTLGTWSGSAERQASILQGLTLQRVQPRKPPDQTSQAIVDNLDPSPQPKTLPLADQTIHPIYSSLLLPNPPDSLHLATQYRSDPSLHHHQVQSALHAYSTRTNQSKALSEIQQTGQRLTLHQQFRQKHSAHLPPSQSPRFDISEVRKVYKQTMKSLEPGETLSEETLQHFRGAGLYFPYSAPSPPPGQIVLGPNWPNTPYKVLCKIYPPLWQIRGRHTVEDLLGNLHWCLLAAHRDGAPVQLEDALKTVGEACEDDGRSRLGRSRALRSVLELFLAYDPGWDWSIRADDDLGIPSAVFRFKALHSEIGLNTSTLHYAINSLLRPQWRHFPNNIPPSPEIMVNKLLSLLKHFRSKYKVTPTPDLYRVIGDYALNNSLPALGKFAWTGWASTYEDRKRTGKGKYGPVTPDLERMDLLRVRFEKKGDGLVKWWRLVRGLREKGWVTRERYEDDNDDDNQQADGLGGTVEALSVVQGKWRYIWVGKDEVES